MKCNRRLFFASWNLLFVLPAVLAICLATLPARAETLVVTSTADSGHGSLRQAISDANSGDTIAFADTLSGSRIVLTNGQLVLTRSLTIDASTLPSGITISGNNTSRIFYVTAGATNVVLDSLTITNGFADGIGGGILANSGSSLTLNHCTLVRNLATYSGGGIYFSGLARQLIKNCTISGNWSLYGGGISAANCYLDIKQCTISQNTAYGQGGGVFVDQGCKARLLQCTVVSNTAPSGNGGGAYVIELLGFINSIIAANYGDDISLSFGVGRGSCGGVNIIESLPGSSGYPFAGTGTIINASPMLAPLGNYGGPTRTMPPLAGSPAIDGCTNGTPFATDQRGCPRTLGLFADIGATEGVYNPAGPGKLTGPTRLDDGSMEFTLTNYSDMSFTVLASTNVTLPASQWSALGSAVESPPGSGQYSFTDPQAGDYPHRFYRVCWP